MSGEIQWLISNLYKRVYITLAQVCYLEILPDFGTIEQDLWRKPAIRIFWYLFGEIIPQFIATLVIFSSVLVISQMIRLTELLVAFGLSLENIILPVIYVVVPFLSITIPIAFLFSVMLAFARLSMDGEFVALLASGYSLKKSLLPIFIIAFSLFGIGTLISTNLESWGRREFLAFTYRKTQNELDNLIRSKVQAGVFVDNFLGFVFYSEYVSPDHTQFKNLMLYPKSRSGKSDGFMITAPKGTIAGSVEKGELIMNLSDGYGFGQTGDQERTFQFGSMRIDLLRLFRDQIFGGDSLEHDYRSMKFGELSEWLKNQREMQVGSSSIPPAEYRKALYLFHNRFAVPFGTIVFFLFAIVFGVSDQRRPKGTAYFFSISVVVVSYCLSVVFKWFSENGYLNAVIAAWAPHVVLLPLGLFLVYQRNRLPISEELLAWSNMPWKRLLQKNKMTESRKSSQLR